MTVVYYTADGKIVTERDIERILAANRYFPWKSTFFVFWYPGDIKDIEKIVWVGGKIGLIKKGGVEEVVEPYTVYQFSRFIEYVDFLSTLNAWGQTLSEVEMMVPFLASRKKIKMREADKMRKRFKKYGGTKAYNLLISIDGNVLYRGRLVDVIDKAIKEGMEMFVVA
jgi:hypothetical protein